MGESWGFRTTAPRKGHSSTFLISRNSTRITTLRMIRPPGVICNLYLTVLMNSLYLEYVGRAVNSRFFYNFDDIDDEDKLKDNLIELKASGCLKMQFLIVANPSEFWASYYEDFTYLAAKVLRWVASPFFTTYICDAGFSASVVIKTTLRAGLDVGSDMRVDNSKETPRIKHLAENQTISLIVCDCKPISNR